MVYMKAKTVPKTMTAKKEVKDPAWEEIKAGFESIRHGKITEWKYPFK